MTRLFFHIIILAFQIVGQQISKTDIQHNHK